MATKEDIIERIKIMQAWVDGADIEFREKGAGDAWNYLLRAFFEFDNYDYRIKPQPKEIWVNEYVDGRKTYHITREGAVNNASGVNTRVAVCYREVIE